MLCMGVPAVKRSPNIPEVLNATTTDFPEALKAKAITTENPVNMNRKTAGEAVLHPGRKNNGQCHVAHMIATTMAAIHGGSDSCNRA